MHPTLVVTSVCYAICVTAVQSAINQDNTLVPTISPSATLPPGAAPTVDPTFAGLAFEARSFCYYAGGFIALLPVTGFLRNEKLTTHKGPDGRPNKFSQNLVQAIANKTNTNGIIRVGGTSL